MPNDPPQTLSNYVWDLTVGKILNNQTGMKLYPAKPAKRAHRKRVQASRKRNRP